MSDVVLTERDGPVGVVTLNRPDALNALSDELMEQLVSALQQFDQDDDVRCIVLGGNDKAFAAGADIGELARSSAIDLYYQRRIDRWDAIRGLWTPLVAAVSGYCLGGGCELAMACDLIVASETAKFGQPETGVGVIPGAGGTQRLTRAVGKSVAMDVILSGRFSAWRRRSRPRRRSRRGWRRRPLTVRTRGRSSSASSTSGACCTSRSPPRTRRRG
jgi:enoyl-CoA hydratase